jgi:propanediol dehydratase large subunit
MYEELVKRLRNDAREQECLLHVCNSTMNSAEAADAIDALEKQLAEKESEIVRIRNSWSNTISDLSGVAAERDKYKASLDQIENIAVGFMESGPCESEALSGLWLVNRVISLALAPLEENRDGT